MKKILAILLLISCGQVMAHEQVNETLDQFHQAAANADFDKYFALFADEGIFMGTDAGERWNKEQFKGFVRPFFSKGKGWLYSPTERNISPTLSNNLVIFDELLENSNYGQCRGSGILIKTGSGWQILQYNLSIPVPNDISGTIVGKIKQFNQANRLSKNKVNGE